MLLFFFVLVLNEMVLVLVLEAVYYSDSAH